MKGLLLKDFYMTTKYCRMFLCMLAFFILVSCFTGESSMFIFFPTLIAGMIPMTLISYDEKEKWDVYSQAFPCSKAQVVTAKYLTGLFLVAVVFALSAGAQALRMIRDETFTIESYIMLLARIFAVGVFAPSLLLPFIFRFGAEKGRIAYYVIIGALCVVSVFLANTGLQTPPQISAFTVSLIILVIACLCFVVSWLFSIRFYKNREV